MSAAFTSCLRRTLSALRRDSSGLAMIEFAFAAPILLTLGLGGMEMANMAATHMRISQVAMQLADNASRIGDRNVLAAERVFESDINDLLIGADIQVGSGLDLYENGRIIISSLERNDDGGQWIHWQRCMGKLREDSSYGPAGTGRTGTGFVGMGIDGNELTASEDGAVMHVEVIYTYSPVIGTMFAEQFIDDLEIRSEAAFTVRGTRDLSQVFQEAGVSAASCSRYEALA